MNIINKIIIIAMELRLMLEVKNITKKYSDKTIFHNLSFNIQNFPLCIMGESGVGKTTLLRIIMGLETVEEGDIHWINKNITSPQKITVPPEKRGFSLSFQESLLLNHKNVCENIEIASSIKNKKEKRKRTEYLLEIMKISYLKNRSTEGLSGGEKQRVALCRAIFNSPSLLLLDEPFNNLSCNLKEALSFDLMEICNKERINLISVTHDQWMTSFLGGNVLILGNNHKFKQGNISELYGSPEQEWVARFTGDYSSWSIKEALDLQIIPPSSPSTTLTIGIRKEWWNIEKNPKKTNAIVQNIVFHNGIWDIYCHIIFAKKNILIRKSDFPHVEPGEKVGVKAFKYFTYEE